MIFDYYVYQCSTSFWVIDIPSYYVNGEGYVPTFLDEVGPSILVFAGCD